MNPNDKTIKPQQLAHNAPMSETLHNQIMSRNLAATPASVGITDAQQFDKGFQKEYGKYGIMPSLANYDIFDELRAQNQSGLEYASRGIAKFALQTSLYTAGGLSTVAYGLGAAMTGGGLDKVWNNDVGHFVDKVGESIGEAFPIYYTQAEQNASALSKIFSGKVWADQVSNALAFTTSAVLTETAAAAIAAGTMGLGQSVLAGTTARNLALFKRLLNSSSKASAISKAAGSVYSALSGLAKTGTVGRQFVTGAFWEASVEARDYMRQAEENYLAEYRKNFFRDPSKEELMTFKQDVINTGNAVFAANVAIVGLSNIITLPKTFGFRAAANAGRNESLNVVQKLVEGKKIYKAAFDNYGAFRKAAAFTYKGLERPVSEAIEEGLQGVAKNTGLAYLADKYDPSNLNYASSFWNNLGTAFEEQITSTDGQLEMLIGMVVGGIGSPTVVKSKADGTKKMGLGWDGGVPSAIREYKKSIAESRDHASALNESYNHIDKIRKDLTSLSYIISAHDNAEASRLSGDNLSAALSDKSALFELVNLHRRSGTLSFLQEDFVDNVKATTTEQYREDANLSSELTEAEVNEHKQNYLKELTSQVKDVSKSFYKAEQIITKYKKSLLEEDEIVNVLANNIYMSKSIDALEKDYAQRLIEITGYKGDSRMYDNYVRLKGFAKENEARINELKKVIEYQSNIKNSLLSDTDMDSLQAKNEELTRLQKQQAQIEKRLATSKNVESLYNNDFNSFKADLEGFLESEKILENSTPEQKSEIESFIQDLNNIYKKRIQSLNHHNAIIMGMSNGALLELMKGAAEAAIKDLAGSDDENAADLTEAEEVEEDEENNPVVQNNNSTPQQSAKSAQEKQAQSNPNGNQAIMNRLVDKIKAVSETIGRIISFNAESFGQVNYTRARKNYSSIYSEKLGITYKLEPRNTYGFKNLILNSFLNIFNADLNSEKTSDIINEKKLRDLNNQIREVRKALEAQGYIKFISEVHALGEINRADENTGAIYVSETGTTIDIIGVKEDGTTTLFMVQILSGQTENINDNPAILEELSGLATIQRHLFKDTYNVGLTNAMVLPIYANVNDSVIDGVEAQTPVSIPFSDKYKGVDINLLLRTVSPKQKINIINKKAFTLGTNFGNNPQPWQQEILNNLMSLRNIDVNSKVEIQLKNEQFGQGPYLPNDESKSSFEAAGIRLQANRMTVNIIVDGVIIGNIKDPLRYVDVDGNPINLGTADAFKGYSQEEYVNEADRIELARQWNAQVKLFEYFSEKLGTKADATISNEEITSFMKFGVNANLRVVEPNAPRPLLASKVNHSFIIEGTPGFIILDNKSRGEKPMLKFATAEISLEDEDSEVVQIFNEAGGFQFSGNFNNRYIAIINTPAGPKMIPLSLKRADDAIREEFVNDIKYLMEQATDAVNRYPKNSKALEEAIAEVNKSINDKYFANLRKQGSFDNTIFEVAFKANSNGDLSVFIDIAIKVNGKTEKVEGKKFYLKAGEVSLESYDSLIESINNKMSKEGFEISNINNKGEFDETNLELNSEVASYSSTYEVINEDKIPVSKKEAKAKESIKNKTKQKAAPTSTTQSNIENIKAEIEKLEKDRQEELKNTDTKLTVKGKAALEDYAQNPDSYGRNGFQDGNGKVIGLAKGGSTIDGTLVRFNKEEWKEQRRLDAELKAGIITQKEFSEKQKNLENKVLLRGLKEQEVVNKESELNTFENINSKYDAQIAQKQAELKALEAKKAEIERRREEELNNKITPPALKNGFTDKDTRESVIDSINEYAQRGKVINPKSWIKITNEIFDKYDAELKALEEGSAAEYIIEVNESEINNNRVVVHNTDGGANLSDGKNAKNKGAGFAGDLRTKEYYEVFNNSKNHGKPIVYESIIKGKTYLNALIHNPQDKYQGSERYGSVLVSIEKTNDLPNNINEILTQRVISEYNKKQQQRPEVFKPISKQQEQQSINPKKTTNKKSTPAKELSNEELEAEISAGASSLLSITAPASAAKSETSIEAQIDSLNTALKEALAENNVDKSQKLNEQKRNLEAQLQSKKQSENTDDDFAPMISFEEANSDFISESAEIQRMLGVSSNRINIITSKFGFSPNLMGAFYNGAIYLANKMPKGTSYHEAFHFVFRTYLNNEEISKLLNYAKNKYALPTVSEIESLRLSQSKYTNLTANELVSLFYEEKLAEEFREYANNQQPISKQTWVQRLWNSIINFVNRFKANRDSVEGLFDSIFKGGFKGKKPVHNIYTNKSQMAPMLLDRLDGNNISKFSATESEAFSNRIVSSVLEYINNSQGVDQKNKTLKSIIEDAITNLAYEFDVANPVINNNLLSLEDPLRKLQYLNYLNARFNALVNSKNIDLLKEDVLQKLKFFNAEEYMESDEYKSTEKSERNFDLGPDNISGLSNVNKKVRLLLGTLTYSAKDEVFGFDTVKAVNPQRLFSTLSKALSNTPKDRMWKKLLIIAKYDIEAAVLADKIKKESGISAQSRKMPYDSNTYNMFASTFYGFKVSHMQVLNSYQDNIVFNSNTKDVDTQQLKLWNSNITYALNSKGKQHILEALKSASIALSGIVGTNQDYIKKTVAKKALELVKAMDSAGMPISIGYAEFSIVSANIDHFNKIIATASEAAGNKTNSEQDVEAPKESNDIIEDIISIYQEYNGDISPLTMSDITEVRTIISNDRNLFSNEEGEGAVTRLKSIAYGNAIFDPTVIASTFKNAEGELVTDYIKGNYLLEVFQEYKSGDKSNPANFVNREAFNKAFPDLKPKEQEIFFNALKSNRFINTAEGEVIFAPNNNILILGGTRQTTLAKNKETDELFESYKDREKEGKSFGNQDLRAKLHMLLSLFAEQKSVKTSKGNINTAIYSLRVNETKNTTYGLRMPVKNYSFSKEVGKFDNGIVDVSGLIVKEINRIIAEKENLLGGFNEANPEISGYNYNEDPNKPIRATDLFLYKKYAIAYSESKVPGFYEKVLSNPEYFSDPNNVKEIYDFAEFIIDTDTNNLYELIISDEINLATTSGRGDKKIKNSFIPKYFLDSEGEIDIEKIKNVSANYLVQLQSFNELLHGDMALAHKDVIDFVKRAAGVSAVGNNRDLGGTKSRGTVTFIKPTTNSISGAESNIDYTDAAAFQHPLFNVIRLLSEGRFTDRVKDIYYNKIIPGKKLTFEESKLLLNEGANLNPDKDVFNDGKSYFKLSMFTLTRELTSNIIDPGQRAALDEIYAELIDLNLKYIRKELKLEAAVSKAQELMKNIDSYWVAKPGYELLHERMNELEKDFIQYFITTSASKGTSYNVRNDESPIEDKNIQNYSNKYWRRQVETSGFKTTITDGTQKTALVWSEQELEAVITLLESDNEVKLGTVVDHYLNLQSERVKMSFENKKALIIDKLGAPKYKELLKSFKASLDAGGSNPFIAEMFDGTDKPNYNLNNLPTLRKFEAMFLNFLSNGVLKQKAPGLKLTLVPNYGMTRLNHNVLDEDGNYYSEAIISEALMVKMGLKEGDTLPPEVLKMLGFRIPTQDKHSMINIKVVGFLPAIYGNSGIFPPEIVYLSGADFDIDSLYIRMKSMYKKGNTIGVYGNYAKESDLYNATNAAFAEHIFDLIANNSEFKENLEDKSILNNLLSSDELYDLQMVDGLTKSNEEFRYFINQAIEKTFGLTYNNYFQEFKVNNEPQIIKNMEAIKDASKVAQYKPLTVSEANNRMLDLEIKLAINEHNLDIANTPASMDDIDEVVKFFYSEEGLGLKEDSGIFSPFSISSMAHIYKNNDDGQKGIGPVAVFNKVFQALVKANIKISNSFKYIQEGATEIFEFNSFDNFLNNDQQRINNVISSYLSAMTDNAKDPKAGKLSLSPDTLGPVLALIGMKLSPIDATMIVNMPAVKSINNKLKNKRSALSTYQEQRLSFKTLAEESQKALSKRLNEVLNKYKKDNNDAEIELDEFLSRDNQSFAIKNSNLLEDSTVELMSGEELVEFAQYLNSNIIALQEYEKLLEVNTAFLNIGKIISLDKGTESSFSDLLEIDDALEALGLTYDVKNKELKNITKKVNGKNKNVFDLFDSKKFFDANPLLKTNLDVFYQNREISSIFAIQETLGFKTLVKAIKNNLQIKTGNKAESIEKLNKDLMSYLTISVFKNTASSSLRDIENVYNDAGELNLTPAFMALRNEPTLIDKDGNKVPNMFKNNLFLRLLSIENRDGFEVLETNSWTQNSDKFISELMSSFEEIMHNKDEFTTVYKNEKVEISPRQFAIDYLKYVLFKDAGQYRNNSAIQQASPKLYRPISKALDILQDNLNQDDFASRISSITGKQFGSLFLGFMARYATDPTNSFDLIFTANLKDELNKDNDTILWADSKKVFINPIAGLTSLSTKENSIYANRIERIKESNNFGVVNAKKGLFSFPIVFLHDGEVFIATQAVDNSNPKKDSSVNNYIDGKGSLIASTVTYQKIEMSTSKVFKNYGFGSVNDQLAFIKKVNAIKEKNNPTALYDDFEETQGVFQSQSGEIESIGDVENEFSVEEAEMMANNSLFDSIGLKDNNLNSTIKGENISSKGSEFAKKLTNVGNTVGLIYKGKKYINSEHAYQTWKSGEFNQDGYDLKGGKVRGGKIATENVILPIKKSNPINIDAKFPKDQVKADYADGIIGYGTHSTGKYAEKFGGTRILFKQGETIMISVNGNNRPNQAENVEKTKKAIDIALKSGVINFIADNKTVANSSHNSGGEGVIRNYLLSLGLKYTPFNGVGLYSKIEDTFSIMTDILTEKLKQHPDLVQGINERGGLAYIEQSTHNVIGDKFWESSGQNKFIEALYQAALNVGIGNNDLIIDSSDDFDVASYYAESLSTALNSGAISQEEYDSINPEKFMKYALEAEQKSPVPLKPIDLIKQYLNCNS